MNLLKLSGGLQMSPVSKIMRLMNKALFNYNTNNMRISLARKAGTQIGKGWFVILIDIYKDPI